MQAKKSIVSLHIVKVPKGGYDVRYCWQVWVNGEHFKSSSVVFYSQSDARKSGVLALHDMDGFFSAWSLSHER